MCVCDEIALGEFPLFAYLVFHGSRFQVTHKHMVSVSQEQSQVIRSLNSRQGVKSTVYWVNFALYPACLAKTLSQMGDTEIYIKLDCEL